MQSNLDTHLREWARRYRDREPHSLHLSPSVHLHAYSLILILGSSSNPPDHPLNLSNHNRYNRNQDSSNHSQQLRMRLVLRLLSLIFNPSILAIREL